MDITNISVDEFFIKDNYVEEYSEEEYRQLEPVIKAVKAFVRSTHQCVYVIDYAKKGFVYVSENISYLCGRSAQEVRQMGYGLYLQHVPEKELVMLNEVNKTGFSLFNNIPPEERMGCAIKYDFHLTNGHKKHLIHHTLTPLVMAPNGHIWLALCTMTQSARETPGKIIMRMEKSPEYYEYNLREKRWIRMCDVSLTETEKDILHLSTQGYTMKEIAEKLCKSVDTVKACKRKMFAKLDVRNIAEAISFAANYNLL